MGIGVEVVLVIVGVVEGRSINEQGALPNDCFFFCNNSMDTSFIAGRGFNIRAFVKGMKSGKMIRVDDIRMWLILSSVLVTQ